MSNIQCQLASLGLGQMVKYAVGDMFNHLPRLKHASFDHQQASWLKLLNAKATPAQQAAVSSSGCGKAGACTDFKTAPRLVAQAIRIPSAEFGH